MKERIRELLDVLPIIDTHEHMMHERDFAISHMDVITLLTPYICDNLLSAGMSIEQWQMINDTSRTFEQRFSMLEPYLPLVKHTTYYKALLYTIKECFGEVEVCKESCTRINEKMKQTKEYASLWKKNKIEKALTFVDYYGTEYFEDSQLLTPVPTISNITPKSQYQLRQLESVTNGKIQSLEELRQAISYLFESYHKSKVKNIKIGSAYMRTLDFGEVDHEAAQEQLLLIARGERKSVPCYGEALKNSSLEPMRQLDDFVIHTCIEYANQYGMNVVVHTGIHAWNRNSVEATRAKYLDRIIAAYPEVTFILLHFGYPYVEDVLLLCKYYKNVYVDFAWVHVLDTVVSKQLIRRVLELLPVNKICGFGGDYCTPYNTIGHLAMAKEHYAQVFGELLEEKSMRFDEVEAVLRMWLYETPKELYF